MTSTEVQRPDARHRTPDIIVQPHYGTVYTVDQEERRAGGFSFGDTNVGLIVSNPRLRAQTSGLWSELSGCTTILCPGIDQRN